MIYAAILNFPVRLCRAGTVNGGRWWTGPVNRQHTLLYNVVYCTLNVRLYIRAISIEELPKARESQIRSHTTLRLTQNRSTTDIHVTRVLMSDHATVAEHI